MAETGNQKNILTTRQRRAIAALLSNPTIEQAAESIGIGARTLHRWMTDQTFKAALAEAEGDMINLVARRLLAMGDSAIDTLEEIHTKQDAADNVRVRAAQVILDYCLKYRELQSFEERLAELERKVADDYKQE